MLQIHRTNVVNNIHFKSKQIKVEDNAQQFKI